MTQQNVLEHFGLLFREDKDKYSYSKGWKDVEKRLQQQRLIALNQAEGAKSRSSDSPYANKAKSQNLTKTSGMNRE